MTASDACCDCGGGFRQNETASGTSINLPDFICLKTNNSDTNWIDGTFSLVDMTLYGNGYFANAYVNTRTDRSNYYYLYFEEYYGWYYWSLGQLSHLRSVSYSPSLGYTWNNKATIPFNNTWLYVNPSSGSLEVCTARLQQQVSLRHFVLLCFV